jgi:hypothetical protein
MRARAIVAVAALALVATASLARAEVIQRGNLRVTFEGEITPRALPRSGTAPVRVEVGTKIASLKAGSLPRLRTITIAINRYGKFDPKLLPACTLREIQPATTENALEACGDSLVGEGTFAAKVLISRQAPFPSAGRLYAFNGVVDGRPAILAHVYGETPVPTSFTLVFELRPGKGTFGTVLRASLPEVTGDSGYITEISLNLAKTVRSHDKVRSYLSASCPAPKGFTQAPFAFAKTTLDFGNRKVQATLSRNCRVRG